REHYWYNQGLLQPKSPSASENGRPYTAHTTISCGAKALQSVDARTPARLPGTPLPAPNSLHSQLLRRVESGFLHVPTKREWADSLCGIVATLLSTGTNSRYRV